MCARKATFVSIYPHLSDTASLYNQVHTDTGSRWPGLHRYHRSDKGHWHIRQCLKKKRKNGTYQISYNVPAHALRLPLY